MKSVIITGCSTGLGLNMAKEFLKKGYRVYATSRDINSLTELKELGAETFQVDLESNKDIDSFVEKIDSVDMVINNAGYAQVGPLLQLSDKCIKDQFQINLFAPLYLIKRLVPKLLKRKRPVVINIGSISGVMATPFAGAYCSSKAGINIYTDVLRMELSPLGIRVVKVLPGIFKSSFGDNAESHIANDSCYYYKNLSSTLLKRAQASQKFSSKNEVVAKKIVSRINRRFVPSTLFVAKGAILGYFTGNYIPNLIKDFIFKKNFNL